MKAAHHQHSAAYSGLGLSLIGLILVGSSALADDSPLKATITELKNKVERRASENTAWFSAKVRDILILNNSVRTDQDAIAELTYGDNTVTRLAPSTTLIIRQQETRVLQLLLGKIWMRLNKGAAKTRVKTPSAIATVIGTTIYVDVKPIGAPTEGPPARPAWLGPQLQVASLPGGEGDYRLAQGVDGVGMTQTTFVVLDQEGQHSLEVQSVDPLTGQPIGNPVTLTNTMGVTIQPGQQAPAPQPVNVDHINTQGNQSGLIPPRLSGAPSGTPSAGVSFNPTRDSVVLPSQELDRTGSNTTGRINVIFDHDGPARK